MKHMKTRAIILIFVGFSISCKSHIIEEESLPEKCPDYVYSVPFSNNIQSVEIEDANFERYLIKQNYDTDKTINGRISLADAVKIEEIDITSYSIITPSDDIIKSVKGIEYFKNLKSFGSVYELIEAIDLSHNIKLKKISIADYHGGVGGGEGKDKYKALKYINLGVNDNLEELSIGSVLVKEIDISKTPNIKKLALGGDYLETIYVKNEKQINPTVLEAYKSKGEIKIIPPLEWQVYNLKGNIEYKICK
jgi:hypothetical protein